MRKELEKMLQKYYAMRPVKKVMASPFEVQYEEDPEWVKTATNLLAEIISKEQSDRLARYGIAFTEINLDEDGNAVMRNLEHSEIYK